MATMAGGGKVDDIADEGGKGDDGADGGGDDDSCADGAGEEGNKAEATMALGVRSVGQSQNECKMFPDVEATAGAAAMVMPTASHKGSSGGFEMAGGETGGCDCATCKCGTACGCSCCSCK
ncbi:hypothetical protein D1007_16289 [Hordeum vulgare]|nr:hypothetical protein D1007_16289 [Hordeum vulgare]